MEGNDDVGEESTFSHGGEPAGSPVVACGPADGAGRVGGAFELVVGAGRFCYVTYARTRTHTSSARNPGGEENVPVCGTPANGRVHRAGRGREGAARSRFAAPRPRRPPTH